MGGLGALVIPGFAGAKHFRRARYKAADPHLCACGCGGITRGKFCPGHNDKSHHLDGHRGRRQQFTSEEIKQHRKIYNAKYNATRRVQHRDRRLKMRYGMSEEKYATLFREQDGKCALCGKRMEYGKLFVDHNHETGIVRGLLCPGCNGALGQFEKIANLPALQEYISRGTIPVGGEKSQWAVS